MKGKVQFYSTTLRLRNTNYFKGYVKEKWEDTVPLRKETVVGEVTGGVQLLVKVAILGLDGVGGEQDGRLGRAVNVVRQDGVLHLQVEEAHRNVLDELLGHVLRVEFGAEFKLQRALLLHVLVQHLQTST